MPHSIARRLRSGLVLIAVAMMAACANVPSVSPTPANEDDSAASGSGYQLISVDRFAAILETESDAYTVVNVHIPYEGEVDGTDLQIPYNDIAALTAALPDKNAPIILYCRSGAMSEDAGRALADLGYTQVWDVEGGMNAWRQSGRALLNR